MNILCVGDFHGKCPNLSSVIKKHKIELILSPGDIPDTQIERKYTFKYWKFLHMGLSLEELLGEKKYKKIVLKTLQSQDKVLKKLNSYNIPIIMVWGNSDISKEYYEKNHKHKRYFIQNLVRKYKNITLVEDNVKSFGDVQILAHSGYRFPSEKGIENKKSLKNKQIIKENKLWDSKLKKLFSKMSNYKLKNKNANKNKITIFLAHEPPLGNKLDLVRNKNSPLYGKHIGDEYFLEYVKKYQPDFMVCGHMHENQGTINIKKTVVADSGSAHDGKYAILNTDKKSISFFR